jgi:hypothetical protein
VRLCTHGPDTKRNFPGETMPVTVGEEWKEERKQRTSSRNIGDCWGKASSWFVQGHLMVRDRPSASVKLGAMSRGHA